MRGGGLRGRDTLYKASTALHSQTLTHWLDYGSDIEQHFEIMPEDTHRSAESRIYESRVEQLLQRIVSNKVGKELLDSLDGKQRYWIVPRSYFGPQGGAAVTFPGAPGGGGGVRVYFSPKDIDHHRKAISVDDVLFHELAHAYRMGRVGYGGLNVKEVNSNDDAEEFFATQLQNVYLSYRGSRRFYRDYNSLTSVSKAEAYDFYELYTTMALKWFLDHEPLSRRIAGWRSPSASFNPWRDMPLLSARALAPYKDLKSLPDFGYKSVY